MKDNAYLQGFAAAMTEGSISVPAILLTSSRGLGLNHSELLLLLQLVTFRQAEQTAFPTLEQLGERLGLTASEAGEIVQKLLKKGFLTIDESFDSHSGMQTEHYNWTGWLERAAAWRTQQPAAAGQPGVAGSYGAAAGLPEGSSAAAPQPKNIFSVFEQEFGRPLSPMELETISNWLDIDRYPEELVRFALKESVFAGKLHFRYIDRILLEWSRNRVTSPEEARIHANKFRGGGKN